MTAKRGVVLFALCLVPILGAGVFGQEGKKSKEVWTDAADATLPVDFKVQGEYVGRISAPAEDIGCQVIALGKGRFQAVLCRGGLPGAGWDGKTKSLLDGTLSGNKVEFVPAMGKRQYLAQSPDQFSATSKFPPVGHKEFFSAVWADGTLTVSKDGKESTQLKKTERKSPTLGAKPPEGAIVLFDGTDTKEWKGGRLDKKTGFLNTDGSDIQSARKLQNYTMHIEFLLPYRPDARGQGRGNSGFYQVHHYEVQILDSFGLDGKNNECGGIYSKVDPKLNMCLPPLAWQAYDVDFTNAVQDAAGKVAKKARITLKLNGVVVHDDVEIPGPTGGHRSDPEGTPGPIILQGHGNPLQFRNIWVVEKK